MDLPDWDLVLRARSGDSGAFGVLVDRHAPALFRAAAALVSNVADAQDVVQETLLAAYQQVGRFEGRSSVKTWMIGILVRQAALHHREAARRRVIPISPEIADTDRGVATKDATGRADAKMDVAQALASLSQDHREVLVLRELEGMTYDEIAAALKHPRGTIESRLFRARQALREVLGE